MGKKTRRQSDPGGNQQEGSDSSEDNKSVCPHVKAFKKRCPRTNKLQSIEAVCKECRNLKNNEESVNSTIEPNSFAATEDFYVCLFCASVGCQGNDYNHALKHQQKPERTDRHDLAIIMRTGALWCFVCEKEVISPAVENHVRTLQKKFDFREISKEASKQEVKSPNRTSTPFLSKDCSPNKKQPLVKGLMNLGNTCFFNSVLQCLAQTPYLIPVLQRLSLGGETFNLQEKDRVEPLEGHLTEQDRQRKFGLTLPLLDLLKKMKNTEENNVIHPHEVLRCLEARYDQFKGREQHDAHELLRHLLEGVRQDDLKRYQEIILKKLGCFGKEAKKASPDTRQRIRTYGLIANNLPLGPDIVFRGQLISTLECQDCKHTSTRTENFLDLSLPVTEEKPSPPGRKKESDSSANKSSKAQLKIERKEKKRLRALERHHRNEARSATFIGPSLPDENPNASNDESDPSDADVEDNVEPETCLLQSKNETDVVESGYSSEKAQNGDSAESWSPVESGCPGLDSPSTVGPPLPFVVDEEDEISVSPPKDLALTLRSPTNKVGPSIRELPPSPPTLKIQDPENLPDLTSVDGGSVGNVSPTLSQDCHSSRDTTFEEGAESDRGDLEKDNWDQVSGIRRCSPSESGDYELSGQPALDMSDLTKKLQMLTPISAKNGGETSWSGSAPNSALGSARFNGSEFGKESNTNCSSWVRTLAPRNSCTGSEGDCSVMSCLNQFTTVELMSGTNKVGCDNCTKEKGKDGKTVYTNSTKQLLISSPPAILILHLKRFIADISRLKKMNRHVSFPMSLDLAPFCSVKCRELPSVAPDQTKIIYSLYGVVEHSGQMGGGHYVAYVKVRPSLGEKDPRWKFLAPDRPFLHPTEEERAPESLNMNQEEKWYYISDSHVSPADEEKVKRTQAYLLFYQRIL